MSTVDESHLNPESIEEAWEAEIERRIDDIESGKAKLIPGEEVFRSIRERCGSLPNPGWPT